MHIFAYPWKNAYFPEVRGKTAGISLTYRCSENCQFCFSKNLISQFPDYMRLEDFKNCLCWLHREGFNYISLLGGEPTEHPQFPEICRIIAESKYNYRKSYYCLITKSSSIRQILKHISLLKGKIGIQIHLTPEELLPGNSSFLSGDLALWKKTGLPLCLRLVIENPSESASLQEKDLKVISLASSLNFGLRASFNSRTKRSPEEWRILAKITVLFIEECLRKRIHVRFVRPLPRCLFNRKQLFRYRRNILPDCSSYIGGSLPHFIINPDLSTFLCCSLHYKSKKLHEYSGIKELNSEFTSQLKKLIAIPIFSHCPKCRYFKNHTCFGGCLGSRSPEI